MHYPLKHLILGNYMALRDRIREDVSSRQIFSLFLCAVLLITPSEKTLASDNTLYNTMREVEIMMATVTDEDISIIKEADTFSVNTLFVEGGDITDVSITEQTPELTKEEFVEENDIPENDEIRYSSDTLSRTELEACCKAAGTEFNIDPYILEALCEAESGLNVYAVNGVHVGLFQISTRYHMEKMQELGGTDIWEPLTNTRVAACVLSAYLEETGNMHHALMRYNMAADTANSMWKRGKITPYARNIVKRADVLRVYGTMGSLIPTGKPVGLHGNPE